MPPRKSYLVVAEPADHPLIQGAHPLAPDEYLEGKIGEALEEGVSVINLCRSYHYLSRGYYVSLLADARNQRAFPTLTLIEEIGNPYSYFNALREAGVDTIGFRVIRGRHVLPKLIPPASRERVKDESPLVSQAEGPARYQPTAGQSEAITSVFGRTTDPRFRKHCSAVYRVYPFPVLKVRFYREEDRWKVGQIQPAAVHQLTAPELAILREELAEGDRAAAASVVRRSAHRIAVLMDEDDPFAPSNDDTLDRLGRVGERLDVLFEKIGKADLPTLPEYDGLFLRTVTGMDHYSFLFAQRARSLGVPVIDDPQITIRCSNKVYLHELFRKGGLATPRTVTITRGSPLTEAEGLGYPLIIKQPDGTFSAAVKKASSRSELEALTREMFRRSPLLTVQEYRPTDFDWRVGVLDGEVIYVCRYYMVKGHWQIAGRSASGRPKYGAVEATPIDGTPLPVRELALQAAGLIGDGLFGVDVKEVETGPVVIEINDNPDLWVGEEDAVEGDALYEKLVKAFLRRIRAAAEGGPR